MMHEKNETKRNQTERDNIARTRILTVENMKYRWDLTDQLSGQTVKMGEKEREREMRSHEAPSCFSSFFFVQNTA